MTIDAQYIEDYLEGINCALIAQQQINAYAPYPDAIFTSVSGASIIVPIVSYDDELAPTILTMPAEPREMYAMPEMRGNAIGSVGGGGS
jgi:hypothetical protein